MDVDRLRREAEARAREMVAAMPAAKRAKLKLEPRDRPREPGFLRQDETVAMLRTHALVRQEGVDPESVHGVLARLLGDKPPPRAPAAPPMQAAPTSSEVCRLCKRSTLTRTTVDGRYFMGCQTCGVEARSFIDYGNPYRNLEDKEDRRHFEATTRVHSFPEVDRICGHARMSAAAAADAAGMLRAHPHVGTCVTAAVGALILASMDYDPERGILRERAPPPLFGVCSKCGTRCATKKAARFHC